MMTRVGRTLLEATGCVWIWWFVGPEFYTFAAILASFVVLFVFCINATFTEGSARSPITREFRASRVRWLFASTGNACLAGVIWPILAIAAARSIASEDA